MLCAYNFLEKIIILLEDNNVVIDIDADNIIVPEKDFRVLRTHPKITKKERKIIDDILKWQEKYRNAICVPNDLAEFEYKRPYIHTTYPCKKEVK